MTGFAHSRLRQLEFLVVLFGILFVIAAGLLSLFGGNAAGQLARISVGTLVGLLALSLVNYLCRAGRWLIYSQRLGVHVPPWRNLLFFVAGFALTTTPGKVGEA